MGNACAPCPRTVKMSLLYFIESVIDSLGHSFPPTTDSELTSGRAIVSQGRPRALRRLWMAKDSHPGKLCEYCAYLRRHESLARMTQ